MNVFELFGKVALDGSAKVKDELTGLEKKTQQVQKGMRVMGAAFTAVGVAGLAIISSTKKINAQLGVTALNLGVTTKEMRDLTLAVTNVTFAISEVTATFDLLARAGVKDTEVLKATATAFDTLGDATGNTASITAGIMIDAMKTFGLTAEEIASKGDMMTHMARNSTIGLEDFATMVGYTDQEMVAAGLTIEDMAAMMMYMGDSGIAPGKVMLREWQAAVTRSKKENISMTEALGMTSEELAKYNGGLQDSEGVMQQFADAANEQYTIMDKLKQKFSEITLGMSGFLEPLEPILAGMTALGPAMIFLSTSVGLATVKWIAHTAALIAHRIAALASAAANAILNASLGPVGWALIAVATAAAIVIPLILKLTSASKEASKGMDDYTKSLFQNELASTLTTAEWVRAYEKGYLLEDQVVKIARGLGISTEKLVENMQAAGLLEAVISDGTETGRLYIRQLEDQVTGLAAVNQQMSETTAAQEALTDSWDDFLTELDPSVRAFKEYGLTTEDVIQYMTRAGDSIDSVVQSLSDQGIEANNVKYHLEELGIAASDVADFVGKKRQAIEEEKTADEEAAIAVEELRKQLQYEASDAGKVGLTTRDVTAALIAQGWTTKRIADLWARLGDDVNYADRYLKAAGLTSSEVDAILKELGITVDGVASSYDKLTGSVTGYGAAATKEFAELEAMYKAGGKTGYAEYLWQSEWGRKAIAGDIAAAQAGAAASQTAMSSGASATAAYTAGTISLSQAMSAWAQHGFSYQHGGPIPEPTLLYGLMSKRPYALAGEAGKEYISPVSPSGKAVNIYVQLDGKTIAKAIGQPLVDEIRVRTGLKS